MAKAGLSVVLIERGEYPGGQNVMGGVMYGRMLADLIPTFAAEAPIERVIVEERLWITTDDPAVTLGHKTAAAHGQIQNPFTVRRVNCDLWFAFGAQGAGA